MACCLLAAISEKRATIARRYRSFYDNSRSCGAAKNPEV